jgi:hypothetical protein
MLTIWGRKTFAVCDVCYCLELSNYVLAETSWLAEAGSTGAR